jgi:hypothetical protein
MKFGDKSSFAVELELDEDHGGAWLFGQFCYWINGIRVGDYGLGVSLRDVLSGMKWIVHDCGNRDGGVLCAPRPEEVFSILDKSLYGNEAFEAANDFPLPYTPARFEITVPVDVFNQWKAFLIECGDRATVLFKNADNDEGVKISSLPRGAFDNVIKDVYDYLDKLHEREIANS